MYVSGRNGWMAFRHGYYLILDDSAQLQPKEHFTFQQNLQVNTT